MQSLELSSSGKEVKKRESKNLAGATVLYYDTSLPQIALAGAPKVSITKPDVSFSSIIYDCVVGIDFWAAGL
jgi:hypothetical protein